MIWETFFLVVKFLFFFEVIGLLNVNVLCLKQVLVFPLFRSTMFFPFSLSLALFITIATGVDFLLSTINV